MKDAKKYLPAPHLRSVISHYYFLKGSDLVEPERTGAWTRILISFTLKDCYNAVYGNGYEMSSSRISVIGPSATSLTYAEGVKDMDIIAVELRPEKAHLILRENIANLLNKTAHYSCFPILKHLNGVADALSEEDDCEKRLDILNLTFRLLFGSFITDNEFQKMDTFVYDLLQNPFLGKEIGDLIKWSGNSEKTIRKKVSEITGMTPRTYYRVNRMERVLDELIFRNTNVHDLVYQYGFYDQSHFIHEMKRFSGYTPNSLGDSSDMLWFKSILSSWEIKNLELVKESV